jgi:hypothetical protein
MSTTHPCTSAMRKSWQTSGLLARILRSLSFAKERAAHTPLVPAHNELLTPLHLGSPQRRNILLLPHIMHVVHDKWELSQHIIYALPDPMLVGGCCSFFSNPLSNNRSRGQRSLKRVHYACMLSCTCMEIVRARVPSCSSEFRSKKVALVPLVAGPLAGLACITQGRVPCRNSLIHLEESRRVPCRNLPSHLEGEGEGYLGYVGYVGYDYTHATTALRRHPCDYTLVTTPL